MSGNRRLQNGSKRYTFCRTCESDVGVTRNSFGRSDTPADWVTARHQDVRTRKWCAGGRLTVHPNLIFEADRPIKAGSTA